MKDYYKKYSSEYSWLIKEEGWVKSLQGVRESQIALGNGFLGSRAVLEEMPYDAKPGTYIAGLYDSVGSQVSELINLPNPFNFKITVDGEKLGVVTMDVIEHRRALNLRYGLLTRHSIFKDTRNRKYDYQSLRFLSMQNKNIGVMQVIFTSLDDKVNITIETGIDTSVYNAGTATEGRKKHFRVKELGQFNNEGYLVVDSFGKKHTAIFRSGFYYETKGKCVTAKDNVFDLKLRKNQTVIFTKVFYINSISKEQNLDKFKQVSEKGFRKSFNSSFSSLLKKHMHFWERLWDSANIFIWNAPEIEKNMRFNIYHMLICAPCDNGSSSVGAKALTSEGYRGHIFWDTEIFMLPFYLYTLPDIAKNILLYRYNRLDVARQIAKKNGYKGAMFPWESAGIGKDETPDRAKDLDGKIIKIHTGLREHHITADIAYAFYHYYNVTHDEKFLKDYGYEVIVEAARFWASRVWYNKVIRKYEIKNVIGPDEFHDDVDNNAFTNMMAKWNLLTAYKLICALKKTDAESFSELAGKIGLLKKEPSQWKNIAARIYLNVSKKQVIEQFSGYFKKKKIKIKNWDENSIPIITAKLTPRDYAKTQLVKQADVEMLPYLLSDAFSLKTKKINYEYYSDRTVHTSSLSLPVYANLAIELDDKHRAYRFFNAALHADLSNLHDNTQEGIHVACAGGVWQVLINGFAGVKVYKETLAIEPKLPKMWRKLLFNINFRKNLINLEISNKKIRVELTPRNKKRKLKIRIFGVLHELHPGVSVFSRSKYLKGKQDNYYL